MAADLVVKHDATTRRFLMNCPGNETAFISYSIRDDGVWDAHHTEVPVSQRGKGLGGVLAEGLFRFAQENNIKLILTCTYLAHYLTKHPDYKHLVKC
jgi:predicted GNAT family acetyltransferase